MTAFGLTGANELDFASGDEDDVLRDEEEARGNSGWSRISKIGTVAEGSLEEEMWRELGALPRSRRPNIRS